MPIITRFPSVRWEITLNREPTASEGALTAQDVQVTVSLIPNLVTAISGTGLTRVITLTTATDTLSTNAVTILQRNFAGMRVTATQNCGFARISPANP